MMGQLSQKSDVYRFVVVLLELLTRINPIDHTMSCGQQSLETWVTFLSDNVYQFYTMVSFLSTYKKT